MAERLERGASGMAHEHWARQIVATADKHVEKNYRLTQEQREALAAELAKVRERVMGLSGAVATYRGFVVGGVIEVRAEQAVGDYLCDLAQREAEAAARPLRAEIDARVPGGWRSLFQHWSLSRVLAAGRARTVQLARLVATAFRAHVVALDARAAANADELERAGALLDAANTRREKEVEPQRLPLRGRVEAEIGALRELLAQMDGRLRSHFSEAFIESLYPSLSRGRTRVADPEEPRPAVPADDESGDDGEDDRS